MGNQMIIKKKKYSAAVVYFIEDKDPEKREVIYIKYHFMREGKLQPGRAYFEDNIKLIKETYDLTEKDRELLLERVPEYLV
jgi:hypothetical protein